MRIEPQSTDPRQALTDRLRAALGPVASRPVAVGGVLTLAVGLPMTSAHLAALEAAWRVDSAAQAAAGHR